MCSRKSKIYCIFLRFFHHVGLKLNQDLKHSGSVCTVLSGLVSKYEIYGVVKFRKYWPFHFYVIYFQSWEKINGRLQEFGKMAHNLNFTSTWWSLLITVWLVYNTWKISTFWWKMRQISNCMKVRHSKETLPLIIKKNTISHERTSC